MTAALILGLALIACFGCGLLCGVQFHADQPQSDRRAAADVDPDDWFHA